MRRLSMKKIKDILRLKYISELSYRQISRSVNVPSSTVSDYYKKFKITIYTIDEFLSMQKLRDKFGIDIIKSAGEL